MRRHLPEKLAYGAVRWKNALLTIFFFDLSKRAPQRVKKLIVGDVRRRLGPDYDVDTHFTPRYNPWDQRLCLVPNGDLFTAIKSGRASVVTDHIDTFTERGIRLRSGAELEADLIITATGLNLVVLGGMQLSVDGHDVDPAKAMSYEGMMYSDVPNLASAFGYTNASWTLKCDLTCEYVCRLLNHMQKRGYRQCTPRKVDPSIAEQPMLDFSSGYVQRSIHKFPKQGSKTPWKVRQNWPLDMFHLRFRSVDDATMEFSNPTPAAGSTRPPVR
jgi:cation diffusion facilitator CzcD-associated flavoprotein CzcO